MKSQEDLTNYRQNFTALSSQAFAASKVNNVPMNHFTGQLSMDVSLVQKKMSVLNFSLGLRYIGGGGIKAEDPGSAFGRGWIVDGGGIIVRNRRGVPDDYKNNLPSKSKFNGILFNQGVTEQADGEHYINWANDGSGPPLEYYYNDGSSDSQHDIFEFSIPGKSGKFYIGKNWEILIVPDSRIKIIPDTTNSILDSKIRAFTIVDEAGIKYYFDKTEVCYEGRPSELGTYWEGSYASAWLLTKIQSPFDEEEIILEYHEGPYHVKSTFFEEQRSWNGLPYHPSQVSDPGVGSWELTLARVVFSDSCKIIVENYRPGPRPGFSLDPFLAKGVKVTDANNDTVLSYRFDYVDWRGIAVGTENRIAREFSEVELRNERRDFMYLQTIKQLSKDNDSITIYSFDYYLDSSRNHLVSNRKSIDFWGFPNGKNNDDKSLIPAYLPDKYADRGADEHFTKMGVLRSVHYPTGGAEYFEYERNIKNDQGFDLSIGGIRLKKRILHDGISFDNDQIIEYKYTNEDGTSSGFLGDSPNFTYRKYVYRNGTWPNNPVVIRWLDIAVSHPVNPLSSVDGSPVGYRRVEEIFKNGQVDNGKVVYEFSDLSYTTNDLWGSVDYWPYRPVDRPFWAVGMPLKTTYFDKEGVKVKAIENEYEIIQKKVSKDSFRSLSVTEVGWADKTIYNFKNYYPVSGRPQLIASKEYNANEELNNPTEVKFFSYDPDFFMLKSSSSTNYKGDTVSTVFFYPHDYTTIPFARALLQKNILDKPISNERLLQRNGETFIIGSDVTEYNAEGIIRPLKKYVSELASPLPYAPDTYFRPSILLQPGRNMHPFAWFTKYDSKGRLLSFKNIEGSSYASILDSYGNVIANAGNASSVEFAYTSFEKNQNMSSWHHNPSAIVTSEGFTGMSSYSGSIRTNSLPIGDYIVSFYAKGSGSVIVNGSRQDVSPKWSQYRTRFSNISQIEVNANGNLIDEFMVFPEGAHVVTNSYKYDGLKSSETDAMGNTVFYEYDKYNRKKNIKDFQGNIIKNFAYSFRKPYVSAAISRTSADPSCPMGSVALGPFTYIVPEGRYTSIISQEDADAKAFHDVQFSTNFSTALFQSNNCIIQYRNKTIAGTFYRNCGPNTVALPYTYNVWEGKHTSVISQADADQKAQADFDANGQLKANSEGKCVATKTITLVNNTSQEFEVEFSGAEIGPYIHRIPIGQSTIKVPAYLFPNVSIMPLPEPLGLYKFYIDHGDQDREYTSGSSDAVFSKVDLGYGTLYLPFIITINNY